MNNNNEIIENCVIALENVWEKIPLTNCITNYVTINDCANAILAIGGSPVMGDDPREIKEFIEIADALVMNIGAINQTQIDAMMVGSKFAKETNTPVILDPVGVGITELRNNIVLELILENRLTLIRGNMSEIKAIARLIELPQIETMVKATAKGVDVSQDDEITKENLKENSEIVKALANEINTLIIASGPIDIISDGNSVFGCENGDPLMQKITGCGCMFTSIAGSFCGTNDPLIGGLSATIAMGIAGEKAGKDVKDEKSGTGTFRVKLFDYLSTLNKETFIKEAKFYEIEV